MIAADCGRAGDGSRLRGTGHGRVMQCDGVDCGILGGSYRLQGPPEQIERDIQKDMSEKRLTEPSMRRKVHTGVQSGTCNVCSAPCSSCMHLKLSCMGSKGDEFSDENCRVAATSQNSVNEDDALPFTSGAYGNLQQHTSEASNLLSVNSNHDALSENVDSKEKIRCSDVGDGLTESEVLLTSPFGGNIAVDRLSSAQGILGRKNLSNKQEQAKIVEGHDDNMSCVSRANDLSTAVSHYNKNVDRKNLSCSSAIVTSSGLQGSAKALLSPKSESLEMPSKNTDASSRSPKYQSRCLSSPTNGQHSEEDTKLGTSKISSQNYPKLETEAKKDNEHQPDGGFKCSNQVEKDQKSRVTVELPETLEPTLQSVSEDDSDESEIVEHDVKVCDICGDAGREDLLAICSKCSDGAEHTYCMREMCQKVPEGDWLCEECKLSEEAENQIQGSDAERMNKARAHSSVKRLIETGDVAPASKRQAIETSFGKVSSPNSSSPTKSSSLSRDSSFKGLDKGKVKLAHQTSFANHTGFESSETIRSSSIASRLQSSKGTLLKSNSFNAVNSKPKVKLVDEGPQKLKSSRDPDMKEGSARMISKSMSFRSVNSVRSGATDSKVKMLSPKFSHSQEIKGLKQVKERNAFESKSLSKLDRPLLGSSSTTSSSVSVPKATQRLTPRGESAMISSTSNNKESKASHTDSKSGSLLRSNSVLARKGSENPVTSVRALSTNGMSTASVEQKFNQVTPKDEPSSSSSWTAERPSNNLDENQQDGLSRLRESSSQSEKTRQSSDNRSKPAVTAGPKHQKVKETGHATELGTNVNVRASDISGSRSVREETSKGSKLKAAIEAAILKKPGIFRKKKEGDQSDGLSSSSMDTISEIASNDQFGSSNKSRNLVSDERADEGQTDLGTCPLENCKQINVDHMKLVNVHTGEAILPSKAGDSDSMVKSSHALAAAPLFSKMLTIPEHESIWQGAIEVRRGGKVFDLYGGVQAHLSTCASPKVLEVVSQFPHKISLDEVPRLSTWPKQFHDSGPKEYNIALYFFAKDLESYERSYKNLLDNMIKRDLALKGSFDGVDFFIFSSAQLPENSQRWNMLFFLWGVFRGTRSNCTDPIKDSVIPSSSLTPLDMNTSSDKTDISVIPDLDSKVSSETNSECQDGRLDSRTLSKSVTVNALFSSENRCIGTSKEEVSLPDNRPDMKNQPFIQPTENGIGSNCKQRDMDALCVDEDSSSIKALHTADHDKGARGSAQEEKMVDAMEVDRNEAIAERNLNDSISTDVEASSAKGLDINQLSSWQSNNRKRPLLDLEEKAVDLCDTSSKKTSWNAGNDILVDGESLNKKRKSSSAELYGSGNATGGNSFGDGLGPQLCDLNSSSSIENKNCEKVAEEKVILEDVGASERKLY
ncbi:RING/FYVE/PHD zinc finger superfamily protein [Euphorbia peplus]|nr:RING/FYVE/PHD zinc finger superfamily protein [Euphorbia peplus]